MNSLPNIPAQTQDDPNSYFVTDMNQTQARFNTKIGPFFHTLHVYLVKIWPWINRALTAIFYFLFGLIKSIIKMAVDQIKNFRGS